MKQKQIQLLNHPEAKYRTNECYLASYLHSLYKICSLRSECGNLSRGGNCTKTKRMSSDELHSILNDNTKCALFDWYLGTIRKTGILKFWLEIRDYKDSFRNEKVEWRLDIARAIFERYLRRGAKNFVDLPNKVVNDIEKKLHSPQEDLFDYAQELVFNRMKNNLLSDFLKSDVYKNYNEKKILPWTEQATSKQAKRLSWMSTRRPPENEQESPISPHHQRVRSLTVQESTLPQSSVSVGLTFDGATISTETLKSTYVSTAPVTAEEISFRVLHARRTGRVDFSACRLHHPPNEIYTMKNLKILNLYRNRIDKLPQELFTLTTLIELNLKRNKLHYLPDSGLSCLKNLRVLRLGCNCLVQLPDDMYRLIELRELELSNNELTDISPEISQLTNLNELRLDHNNFTQLPFELGRLTSLRRLFLHHNQLTILPPSIGLLTSLLTIDIDNNPLLSPPISSCYRGRRFILSYLQTKLLRGPNIENISVVGRCLTHGVVANDLCTFEVNCTLQTLSSPRFLAPSPLSNEFDLSPSSISVLLVGPVTIPCHVTFIEKNRYECVCRAPQIAGKYTVKVRMNDVGFEDTKYEITVHPGEVDARQSLCRGLGIAAAYTKQQSQFTIVTKDKFGNYCNSGGESFLVTLDPNPDCTPTLAVSPSLRGNAENTRIVDNHNGTYTVTYQIQKHGKYKLSVLYKHKRARTSATAPSISSSSTNATQSFVHIGGSPFDVTAISAEGTSEESEIKKTVEETINERNLLEETHRKQQTEIQYVGSSLYEYFVTSQPTTGRLYFSYIFPCYLPT
jgi:hypothetical protein